jgi:Ca2+-binding RTX toxin-like protein
LASIFNGSNDAVVNGTDESDTIISYGNNDTIYGFGGDDTVLSAGEVNLIYGDSLVTGGPDSGTGSDLLVGRAGPDTIWGGASADTMSGGDAGDVFSFGWVPQAKIPTLDTTDFQGHDDLISDFSQDEGDVIDLAGYATIVAEQGVFLGTRAFTDENVLQVRYEAGDQTTTVQFRAPISSEPGVTPVTGEIDLAGTFELTAGDFAPDLKDDSGVDGGPPPGEVDWNALAEQVLANYAATGTWFL